jgi:AraC family transcriptional regulator, transcriptional activator of pobA
VHDKNFYHRFGRWSWKVSNEETGKPALEHIQAKLTDIAKEKIFQPGKSVSEIAYELGFKYPNYFSRFFKQQVGYTPNEYRSSLN